MIDGGRLLRYCRGAHLRRLFAEEGRPSPQAELVRLRMDVAKRCLLDGWTQKAVAELLGFSEPSAFARAFRDFEGMPAGAWLVHGKDAR
ncbi:MAG TPA: helix-turn-helix domain-containing protein [Rariglobus sp.]